MAGKNKILITGSSAGLGSFLTEKLNAVGLTRENSADVLKVGDFDLIVHCAFSKPQSAPPTENLDLLKSLLGLTHKQFIFVSSSDVYPDDSSVHTETETLTATSARSDYARQKIECEELVLKNAQRPIIIRPVSLIGLSDYSHNLKKIISEDKPVLTLTGDSRWNFVTYEELLQLILSLRDHSFTGVINLARSQPVTLESLAKELHKQPVYGHHRYRVAELSNSLCTGFLPQLGESSLQFFRTWVKKLK